MKYTSTQLEGEEPIPGATEFKAPHQGGMHCTFCGEGRDSHIPGPDYSGMWCPVYVHPDILEDLYRLQDLDR